VHVTAFIFDYVLLAFVCTLGVVQIAAARSGLLGLLFVRRPQLSMYAGAAVVAGAFTWYFAGAPRNVPDTAGGLDGVDQTLWLAVGAAPAIALTFLATSVLNHRWGADKGWDPADGTWPPAGMTWLERTTFLRALWARYTAVRAYRRRAESPTATGAVR
jgi:hypothetical protein